jgi:ADP-ribosylglycohydrolase
VSQVKIPKITADWKKLEELVILSSNLKHKPSIGQMAAMVLHLALGRIPEKELKEAVRREFA